MHQLHDFLNSLMLPQRAGMCSQLAPVGFLPILNGPIPSTIQNSEREKRTKYGRWEKMGRYIRIQDVCRTFGKEKGVAGTEHGNSCHVRHRCCKQSSKTTDERMVGLKVKKCKETLCICKEFMSQYVLFPLKLTGL